jgi:acyl carrier protein
LDEKTVYDRLESIFREVFDENNITISSNTTAADINGWDSFGHLNLIVAIESSFGMRFAITETADIQSVGDIVDIISRGAV